MEVYEVIITIVVGVLMGVIIRGLWEGNKKYREHSEKLGKQFLFIILKLKTMSAELDAIKADLVSAQALQQKIAADVTRLHDQITALGDAPTPEQLAEVKALSSALVTSLQATDDATPE